MNSTYVNRQRLLGCLAASLLGVTGIIYTNVATAAITNQRDAAGAEQPAFQRVSADDPVVLRGTRPAPVAAQSHGLSGNRPTWIVAPWFVPAPATGFDYTLDRDGLSPPGGIMNLSP
jgi:hypothetical protein